MSEFFKKMKLHEPFPRVQYQLFEKLYDYIFNNIPVNMKKFAGRKGRKTFIEATFSHSRKHFSKFPYKICVIILPNTVKTHV